ncbi:DNA-binding transcriptional regulator, LysR family [Lutimaribacter pacificus]|uniref:DNA-binding transcriptional regulator, LysR family n=1 Tax=Lutimaribacter pacificus TaxID=391948 RepID=A0A1H0NV43_9RHOB|nr:LysR family transcriptional regulator [Lutimaribacter pacificus]SDO96325.1 DNA-binding transcriptional regulator, LysR family [Lutimaribacter pacificus]SHK94989.1 DNA-binding transcriptional regulator, LysR family [Lutimaribacter pacificus]
MKVAPALSLDQMQVLLTVVDTGSFAAAGRKLGRATSAISYAIDTLENQLGLDLFDRETRRRPTLSQAGQAVVIEARAVVQGADMLRARVKALVEGLEAEVTIAVDQIMPQYRLAETLGAFHQEFPAVPLRIRMEALGGVERLVRSGETQIGIGGALHMNTEGLTVTQIDGVRIIPVAGADHPLAREGFNTAARDHLQIVVADSVEADQRACVIISSATWRVSDLTSAHALLVAGTGWGVMPEPMVREDIAAGRLVHLDVPDFREGHYPLQIAHKVNTPPGPAGHWLIERLTGDFGQEATIS